MLTGWKPIRSVVLPVVIRAFGRWPPGRRLGDLVQMLGVDKKGTPAMGGKTGPLRVAAAFSSPAQKWSLSLCPAGFLELQCLQRAPIILVTCKPISSPEFLSPTSLLMVSFSQQQSSFIHVPMSKAKNTIAAFSKNIASCAPTVKAIHYLIPDRMECSCKVSTFSTKRFSNTQLWPWSNLFFDSNFDSLGC